MNRGYSGAPQPYSDFSRRRVEHEADAALEQARAERENAAAKDAWAAKLEAQREEQRQRDTAQLEARLAPIKTRLQRQWLADHIDQTPDDFNRHAWPRLRANAVEELKAQDTEAQERAFKAGVGGVRYGF